jgi:hypothetical protein
VAALGLGVSKFALGGEEEAATPDVAEAVAPQPAQPAPAEPAAVNESAPDAEPAKPKAKKTALQKALIKKNKVVVVVLYAPKASLDSLATREARAGAAASKAGFLAVNVLNERAAKSLAKQTTLRSTPTVLIFTRSSQEIVTQFEGVVDRETVAQAAANARR